MKWITSLMPNSPYLLSELKYGALWIVYIKLSSRKLLKHGTLTILITAHC